MRKVLVRGQKFTTYAGNKLGERVTEFTEHDQHYLDGKEWRPVVEAFEAKDGQYIADRMNNIIRVGADGSRRWYPRRDRDEYVEIGIPQSHNGNFSNVSFPDVALEKAGRDVELRITGVMLDYQVKWSGLKTILTLEDGAPLRWRYPISYHNLTVKDKRLFGKDGEEVGRITPTTAVDASGQELAVKETHGKDSVEVEIILPERVAYPITVDPDFTCGTADGYIYGTNRNYGLARITSFAGDQTSSNLWVGQRFFSSDYYVYRSFVLFDTSSIPDGAIITQVNLKLTAATDASTTDFDVQIVKTDWSSNTDFSNATQRENAYDACVADDADDSIWRNTSGISLNTTYTSGNLNTAWVSKTGTTYYGLRSSRDKSATTPSGDEHVLLYSQEATTSSYRPVLVVAYTEADSLTAQDIEMDVEVSQPTLYTGHALTAQDIEMDVEVSQPTAGYTIQYGVWTKGESVPYATYYLKVYNTAGSLEYVIDDYTSLGYRIRVNHPGIVQVTIRGDHPLLNNIDDDWQIEVWRNSYDGDATREITGLYRRVDWDYTDQSRAVLTCPGLMHMLARRHILYPAAIANRTRFLADPAETIANALVKYNATASGTVLDGRDKAAAQGYPFTGLSVEGDGMAGNTLSIYCARRNLLDQLQEIARAGGGDFNIVKTSSTAWQWRWYDGQLGTDRTTSVFFALSMGNMANPQYTRDAIDEKTFALVGGQGEKDLRETASVEGDTYAVTNDIELFVDAREAEEGQTAALTTKGEEALKDNSVKEFFSFEVLQVENARYGTHYFVGDLVTGINPYTTTSHTMKIDAVAVTAEPDGGEEKISIDMEIQ